MSFVTVLFSELFSRFRSDFLVTLLFEVFRRIAEASALLLRATTSRDLPSLLVDFTSAMAIYISWVSLNADLTSPENNVESISVV